MFTPMETENDTLTIDMANCLKALGNPVRLRVFRALVKAGKGGANMGSSQREVDIPASTLTHHIQRLAKAGLLEQSRKSRELICQADYGLMESLVDYLTVECCQGLAVAEKKEFAT